MENMISEGNIVISTGPGYTGNLFYVEHVIRSESGYSFECCRGQIRAIFMEDNIRLATQVEMEAELVNFLLV